MVNMKTKSPAESFFSPEEQQRIRDAVHQVELKTSGELVPMVVSESHSYPLAPIRGAALIAFMTALAGTPAVAGFFWLQPSNLWVFLGIFFPVFCIVYYLVATCPSLKRLCLINSEMEAEVENSAITAFFTEKLYRTQNANGILIFISLLERRAWILADSGINERIPQERWAEIVAIITRGIREKQQCQALCEAIRKAGEILEKEFPVQDDDINELHDLIIR